MAHSTPAIRMFQRCYELRTGLSHPDFVSPYRQAHHVGSAELDRRAGGTNFCFPVISCHFGYSGSAPPVQRRPPEMKPSDGLDTQKSVHNCPILSSSRHRARLRECYATAPSIVCSRTHKIAGRPHPGHPVIPKTLIQVFSGLQDPAIALAGMTGRLLPPSVIDAREASQGFARGSCQQNRTSPLDKPRTGLKLHHPAIIVPAFKSTHLREGEG